MFKKCVLVEFVRGGSGKGEFGIWIWLRVEDDWYIGESGCICDSVCLRDGRQRRYWWFCGHIR